MKSINILFSKCVLILGLAMFCSSFTIVPTYLLSQEDDTNCPDNEARSDYVVGDYKVVYANHEILSAQTIAANSTVVYRSGSGTSLSYGMTGALNGPSPTFQIFKGSTLTIEIGDCPL